MGASSSRAAARLPWRCHNRARLMAVRSSQDGGYVQDGLPRQQLSVQPMQLGFEHVPSKREPLLPL